MADFCVVLEARGEACIPNMSHLTMFADYRVPQALVHLGALQYSDSLMTTLKEGMVPCLTCVLCCAYLRFL